jgi:cell division protein FtsL
MPWKIIFSVLVLLFVICSALSLCTGCATQSPVVIDTGNIERLRYEYEQLRSEYDKLQQDYSRLVAESQFYADYYRNATAAIEAGIRELGELGTDSAGEIAKIRTNLAVLRNIINQIIAGQSGEGRQNTGVDAD